MNRNQSLFIFPFLPIAHIKRVYSFNAWVWPVHTDVYLHTHKCSHINKITLERAGSQGAHLLIDAIFTANWISTKLFSRPGLQNNLKTHNHTANKQDIYKKHYNLLFSPPRLFSVKKLHGQQTTVWNTLKSLVYQKGNFFHTHFQSLKFTKIKPLYILYFNIYYIF